MKLSKNLISVHAHIQPLWKSDYGPVEPLAIHVKHTV